MLLPDLVVLFITYNRPEYAWDSLRQSLSNLKYDGQIKYYLADAGSPDGQHDRHKTLLEVFGVLLGEHSETLTPGANWNRAIKAFEDKPVYLRLEDDFILREPIDVTPYVQLLLENESVGMVRLGLLPIGLDCYTEGHGGIVYLNILHTKDYSFSGNPGLIHQRLHRECGLFNESTNPGDTEVDFDAKVRRSNLKILRPARLGDYSPWAHIGGERSY